MINAEIAVRRPKMKTENVLCVYLISVGDNYRWMMVSGSFRNKTLTNYEAGVKS